jgi:hypothetical protein
MKGFSFKAGVRVKESLKRAHAAVRNKAAMSRILKGKSSRHKVQGHFLQLANLVDQ